MIRILDCMLEKEEFLLEDRVYISMNRDFLKKEEIFYLLEKEFFSYTKKLLIYLQNGNYDEALREYITNSMY